MNQQNRKSFLIALVILLVLGVGTSFFVCGLLFVPTLNYFAPPPSPFRTATPEFIASFTPVPSATKAVTPSPVSQIYLTLNVNDFQTYTVYWDQALWREAVGDEVLREDFEMDSGDFGELTFPYLSGNEFLLQGDVSAQILSNSNLLPSGNILHFRTWGDGLDLYFPDTSIVSAFGFDYRSSEAWQLTFNQIVIELPKGRNRFVGVVIHEHRPVLFNLSCIANAQGGLSLDDILYAPVALPSE